MRLTALVEQTGKTTTGIRLPQEVLDELGAGRRPRIVATIDGGYVLRTTVGTHDGDAFISISAAVREEAGIAGGDTVELDVEVDTAPRVIEVPEDLASAMDADPAARRWFDGLTASQQKAFVVSVTGAKQPETRRRRIDKAVAALAAQQKRP
jgi:hypothetical protein